MQKPEPERILVVDDDPDILTIASLALETIGGFEIETCPSGHDALERVGMFRPDLILLDAMMPGMDGPETFSALNRVMDRQEIPIVFFTGRTQSEDIAKFKALGAVGVVEKPFDPMSLAQTVMEIWQRNSA